ncbi:MAG: hypothetical protein ORN28_09490 [Rhodoferax sp.]|nr:hypothetical protein [Rhodoferax sp.]
MQHVEGLSYAEIGRAVGESIKHAIMQEQDKVQTMELVRALEERRHINAKLTRNNKPLSNHAGTSS